MLQLQITDQKDSEVNEKFPYIHQVKKNKYSSGIQNIVSQNVIWVNINNKHSYLYFYQCIKKWKTFWTNIYVDIQVNEVMKGHCFTEPPKPCTGK